MTIDLSSFGPWKDDVCDVCEVLVLVTGPEGGEQRCKACWFGEMPVRHRRRKGQAETLFETGPYEARREGA